MKCAPYDPDGRAGALPPPTRLDDCTAKPTDHNVIASPKGVAIPRYALRNRTICQEIPTVASLPRNDNGESWCEGIKMPPDGSGGHEYVSILAVRSFVTIFGCDYDRQVLTITMGIM